MGVLGTSIRSVRPKCGLEEPATLTQAQIHKRYAVISTSLSHHFVQSEQCTEHGVAKLVSEMRAFLDEHLGRNSDPRRRPQLTIFPAVLFQDVTDFGALSTILHAVFQFAEENGIRPVSFSDPKNQQTYFRILLHVEKLLKKHHFLNLNKVFISPLIPEQDANNLRDILQAHDAAIVSTADVATHIVYPDLPGTSESDTDDQLLIRLLDKLSVDDKTFLRVHWLHHPDSYDDWLPESDVLGRLHLPYDMRDQHHWHVQARWVRDLGLYNEWMNELDYELPPFYTAFVDPPPLYASTYPMAHSLSRVRLRLRMTDSERKAKRRRSDSNSFRMIGLPSLSVEEPDDQSLGAAHDSQNGSILNDDEESASASEHSSEQDSDADTEGRKVSSHPPEDDMDKEGEQQDLGDSHKGADSRISIGNDAFMPSYSNWFRLNAVHDIERRALPEFFSGTFPSKTEMSYREVRNFMILTWRKSPKQYISGTAARRHFSGDACSVIRVHEFLEHWGLINYCSPGESAPPPLFAPPPRPLPVFAGSGNDDACRKGIPLMTDDGSRAEVRDFAISKFGRNGEELKSASQDGTVLIRETDQNASSGQIADRPQREPIEYHCDSCGVDCSELRFHCATKADMDLCASCYQNSKYADSVKPRDFIQMNSAGVHSNFDDIDVDMWTESERLLLLEALEMFGDNWTLVSEHVGSKGKAQCVAQFLRLPIEDPFLTNTTNKWWTVEADKRDSTSTPTEMLRKAGAREVALASIAARGSSTKVFSGRPLICGDQISTIVPFAGLLSSLVPAAILEDLINGIGIPPRRRVHGAFRDLLKSEVLRGGDRNGSPHGDGDNREEMAVEEHMISNCVYKQLSQRMTQVSSVINSESGLKITNASLALLNDGAIPPQDLSDLHIEDPLHVLHEQEKEAAVTESDDEKKAAGKGQVDAASSAAVALTALTAAGIRAAQWREIESVEIDRLVHLSHELRLAMIRLKVEHLSEINRHVLLSRRIRRKDEQNQFKSRIERALQLSYMEEDGMEDVDIADYLNDTPVFESWNQNETGRCEKEIGVAGLQIRRVASECDTGSQEAFLSWTDVAGYKSEVNQDTVPVVSGVMGDVHDDKDDEDEKGGEENVGSDVMESSEAGSEMEDVIEEAGKDGESGELASGMDKEDLEDGEECGFEDVVVDGGEEFEVGLEGNAAFDGDSDVNFEADSVEGSEKMESGTD